MSKLQELAQRMGVGYVMEGSSWCEVNRRQYLTLKSYVERNRQQAMGYQQLSLFNIITNIQSHLNQDNNQYSLLNQHIASLLNHHNKPQLEIISPSDQHSFQQHKNSKIYSSSNKASQNKGLTMDVQRENQLMKDLGQQIKRLNTLFEQFSVAIKDRNVQIWKLIAFSLYKILESYSDEAFEIVMARIKAKIDKLDIKQTKIPAYEKQSSQIIKSFSQKKVTDSLNCQFKPNITLSQLIALQFNISTIQLIDAYEPYKANFILFLIPFNYLLLSTLHYYQHPEKLYIFTLFQHITQRIHSIKLSSNPQLEVQEIDGYQLDFACYRKERKNDGLSKFVVKYKDDMLNFIPVYYQLLHFHGCQQETQISKITSKESSPNQKYKQHKQCLQKIYTRCRQYHNQNI